MTTGQLNLKYQHSFFVTFLPASKALNDWSLFTPFRMPKLEEILHHWMRHRTLAGRNWWAGFCVLLHWLLPACQRMSPLEVSLSTHCFKLTGIDFIFWIITPTSWSQCSTLLTRREIRMDRRCRGVSVSINLLFLGAVILVRCPPILHCLASCHCHRDYHGITILMNAHDLWLVMGC